MQQSVNLEQARRAGEFRRQARALLPLLVMPALPALVACNTDEVRTTAPAITPEVVARAGVPPLLLRPLSKTAAEALNQRIPFSHEPVLAAAPFTITLKDKGETLARAAECLTTAIYYEAATESEDGKRAVAQVILNRLRHPAFPATVCGVIYQGATLRTGCQFSFTCDGSLQRIPAKREWLQAREVAEAALAGSVYAPVGLATHYHADYVVPYWAPSLAKTVQVGRHIFYRWAGDWGRPPSFTQSYAKRETAPLALRNLALLSHGIWPGAASSGEPRLSLTIDPDVELGGIVQMLSASASADAGTPLARDVRAYFGGEPAETLLQALRPEPAAAEPASKDESTPVAEPGEPPAAPAPVAAGTDTPRPTPQQLVRAFGSKTDATRFLRVHRQLYLAATKQLEARAEQSASNWETYTGNAVAGSRAALSLTRRNAPICPALQFGTAPKHLIVWSEASQSDARLFTASGLADSAFQPPVGASRARARQLAAALAPIRDQLVGAVFVRIAALQGGAKAADDVLRTELAQDHKLVPILAERLRFYEAHRADFATLNDFLPRLIANLPLDLAKAKPGVDVEPCNVAAAEPTEAHVEKLDV